LALALALGQRDAGEPDGGDNDDGGRPAARVAAPVRQPRVPAVVSVLEAVQSGGGDGGGTHDATASAPKTATIAFFITSASTRWNLRLS